MFGTENGRWPTVIMHTRIVKTSLSSVCFGALSAGSMKLEYASGFVKRGNFRHGIHVQFQ